MNALKTALICPIPELGFFAKGNFHLVLSHLLDNSGYFWHYQKLSSQGAILILDNSAHEFGQGQTPKLLLEQALDLGASILVCPDVLEKGYETIELTSDALFYYAGHRELLLKRKLKLMLVPQGETLVEWGKCFKHLLSTYETLFPNIDFVLGVSKDYERFIPPVNPGPQLGGLDYLLKTYVTPALRGRSFQVHMLGWGSPLENIYHLRNKYPAITSTDSAKPFVYAQAGIDISKEDNPVYPKRTPDYFFTELTSRERELALLNIQWFFQLTGESLERFSNNGTYSLPT